MSTDGRELGERNVGSGIPACCNAACVNAGSSTACSVIDRGGSLEKRTCFDVRLLQVQVPS